MRTMTLASYGQGEFAKIPARPENANVTGGWQNWTMVTAMADLPAGIQVMRFAIAGTSAEYNLNWLRFSLQCTAGDLNRDGLIDGRDIPGFVSTLLSPETEGTWENCSAKIDQDAGPALGDLPGFVNLLLAP